MIGRLSRDPGAYSLPLVVLHAPPVPPPGQRAAGDRRQQDQADPGPDRRPAAVIPLVLGGPLAESSVAPVGPVSLTGGAGSAGGFRAAVSRKVGAGSLVPSGPEPAHDLAAVVDL